MTDVGGLQAGIGNRHTTMPKASPLEPRALVPMEILSVPLVR